VSQVLPELVSRLRASRLIAPAQLDKTLAQAKEPVDERKFVESLVKQGLLTKWQASQVLAGHAQGSFLGKYKLLDPLGAGGMGQVFRAMDTDEGWHVAVKVLPKKFATPDAVRRFEREGQTSLRVQHPNIVRTMEIGQQGSTYFLVMEMVIGTDLAKIIRQSGKLSVGQTARVGYDVALGLEHARQLGVVHRDVKPSNILIAADGTAKLTDLGLAKFFGGSDEAASLTNTGAVLGTVDYISPEQAEDAKRADTRSDVYSLGCTLYHCLTGRAPFADGTTFQRLLAHREEDAEPISTWNPDVPRELDELIVKKMMAKARGLRLQTPAEVAAALEPWARSAAGTRPLAPIPAASLAASDAESDSGSPSTQTEDAAADSAKKYITAVCPVCGTRMAATHDQAGTKIECPDCNTKVPVPWPSQRAAAPQPQPEQLSSYDIVPAPTRTHMPVGEFVAATNSTAAPDAARSFIPDREITGEPAASAPLVDWSPRRVRKFLTICGVVVALGGCLAGPLSVYLNLRPLRVLDGSVDGSQTNGAATDPVATHPLPSPDGSPDRLPEVPRVSADSSLLGEPFVDRSFGISLRAPKQLRLAQTPNGWAALFVADETQTEMLVAATRGTESLAEFETATITKLAAIQRDPPSPLTKFDPVTVKSVAGGDLRFDLFAASGLRTIPASGPVRVVWLVSEPHTRQRHGPLRHSDRATKDGRIRANCTEGTLQTVLDDATATPDSAGIITAASDGQHVVRAVCTDAAGNEERSELAFQLDTQLPQVFVRLRTDSGSSNSDRLTNDGTVVFGGDMEQLDILVDGTRRTRDADGMVRVSGDGSHRVAVATTDLAGNTGTAVLDFVLDTLRPKSSAALVKDSGANANDRLTNDRRVAVVGEGSTIVKLDGVPMTVDANGQISISTDGSHTITQGSLTTNSVKVTAKGYYTVRRQVVEYTYQVSVSSVTVQGNTARLALGSTVPTYEIQSVEYSDSSGGTGGSGPGGGLPTPPPPPAPGRPGRPGHRPRR